MSSELGPYGTTEDFFKQRALLLANKPRCPLCNLKSGVGIYIQLKPVSWICHSDNTRWNLEIENV